MRTITHGDIAVAAHAVRGQAPDLQRYAILRFLDRAHAADLFRKRFGRAHPFWGNGSLMAVVLGSGMARPEPFCSDTAYLGAFSTVIETVLEWRDRAR